MSQISVKDAFGVTQTVNTIPDVQVVSASALPLPTGAATAAKQDTIIAALTNNPDVSLLNNAAATGASVPVIAHAYNWYIWGVWNGATAKLQFSPDAGTTWIDFDSIDPLTANGGWNAGTIGSISAGHVRVLITGAGGSTSLTSKLGGVP